MPSPSIRYLYMYSRANPAFSRPCSNRTDPASSEEEKQHVLPTRKQAITINRLEKGGKRRKESKGPPVPVGPVVVFFWCFGVWRSLACAPISSTSRSVVDCRKCGALLMLNLIVDSRRSGPLGGPFHWYQVSHNPRQRQIATERHARRGMERGVRRHTNK